MADHSQDQDKTEQATPFKLDEARRKGQVFKSPELNSLAALTMALLALLAFGGWAIDRTLALGARLLTESGRAELTPDYVMALTRWSGERALLLLAPIFVLLAAVGILSNLLQTGPVFSFAPLKPDFQRLNPIQGFKRIFSFRSVYEAIKAVLKLALLAGVTYGAVDYLLPKLLGLPQRSISAFPEFLRETAAFVLFVLVLGFLALALVDLAFTRWEYLKKMRMSRRELRDEIRRREGDPQIRSKRRDLQRAMRKRAGAAGRVKDADVLITNPTHLAVALRYRREEAVAPVVVAKGAGELALRMREMAFRYGVTVVESPVLARRLFANVDLDDMIPEETYEDVAAILKRVFAEKTTRSTRP